MELKGYKISEETARRLMGEARYQLLLLRGRMKHLKPFFLENQPEATREFETLLRQEARLSQFIEAMTEFRLSGHSPRETLTLSPSLW